MTPWTPLLGSPLRRLRNRKMTRSQEECIRYRGYVLLTMCCHMYAFASTAYLQGLHTCTGYALVMYCISTALTLNRHCLRTCIWTADLESGATALATCTCAGSRTLIRGRPLQLGQAQLTHCICITCFQHTSRQTPKPACWDAVNSVDHVSSFTCCPVQPGVNLAFLSARPESVRGFTEADSFKNIFNPLLKRGELYCSPVLLLGSLHSGPAALISFMLGNK